MSLIDKIPDLSDEQVENMLANAQRLSITGDERQQLAASEILPALEEASSVRKAAKAEATLAKRAAARKPSKAKVAAAA